MSGVKYSSYEIQRELRERQKCMSRLNELKRNIDAIRERINNMLNKMPEGVKDSFSSDIKSVQNWMKEKLADFYGEMGSSKLKNIIDEYEKIKEKGENALSTLVEVLEVKREEKAKELMKNYERLKAEISGYIPLFKKWKSEEYEKIKEKENAIISLINKENFRESEGKIDDLKEEINRMKMETSELEEKDNQRRYVLEALRKVCKDMGWEEKEIENLENPKEAIIFKVDTYSSGTMTFYISLEKIKVYSPLVKDDGTCIKEFNKVSEKLKGLGVETKFKMEGDGEEPKLIQKSVIDIPDSGMEKEMEK